MSVKKTTTTVFLCFSASDSVCLKEFRFMVPFSLHHGVFNSNVRRLLYYYYHYCCYYYYYYYYYYVSNAPNPSVTIHV